MAETLKIGVEYGINISKIQQDVNQAKGIFSGLGSAVSKIFSDQPSIANGFASIHEKAKDTSKKVVQTEEEAARYRAEVQKNALAAYLRAEERNNQERTQLQAKSTDLVIAELEREQAKKRDIQRAYEDEQNADVKRLIAIEKRASDQRLRILNEEARKRQEVINEGAGARVGILGVGRSIFDISKIKGDLQALQSEQNKVIRQIASNASAGAQKAIATQTAKIEQLEKENTDSSRKELALEREKLQQLLEVHARGNAMQLAQHHAALQQRVADSEAALRREQAQVTKFQEQLSATGKKLFNVFGGAAITAGVGIAFHQVFEEGMKVFDISDNLQTSFMSLGLSQEQVNKQMQLTDALAGRLNQKYHIHEDRIKELAGQSAILGGAFGKQNEQMTTLGAGVEKATNGLVKGEDIIRMFSKGLQDPENAQAVDRLKSKFPALYAAIEKGETTQDKLNLAMAATRGMFQGLEEDASGPEDQFEVFQQSTEKLTRSLGVVVITGLTPFFQVVGGIANFLNSSVTPSIFRMATSGGVLGTSIKVVGGIITLAIAGLAAYAGYTSLVTFLHGQSSIAIGINAAMTKLHAVGSWIATAATGAWTVATTALGVAFKVAMGPVGWIITGIGLLVAGIIYAYKHSEAFRNVLNTVWEAIKKGTLFVLQYLTPFGQMYTVVKLAYEHFSFFRNAIDSVSGALGKALGPIGRWIGLTKDQTKEEKAAGDAAKKTKEEIDEKNRILKESNDAVTKYIEGLKKQQQAEYDNAKAAVEGASVVLLEIDRQLANPNLKGAERAVFEERRKQWAEYAKINVQIYQQQEKDKEKINKETGVTSTEKEQKAAGEKEKKNAKELWEELKSVQQRGLEQRRQQVEIDRNTGVLDEQTAKRRLLELEAQYTDQLLTRYRSFFADHRAVIQSDRELSNAFRREETALEAANTKAMRDIRDNGYQQLKADSERDYSDNLEQLTAEYDGKIGKEKEFNLKKIELEIEYQELMKSIARDQGNKDDQTKAQQKLNDLRRAWRTAANDLQREQSKKQLDDAKQEYDAAKQYASDRIELIQDEGRRKLAEEDLRHRDRMVQLRLQLAEEKLTRQQYEKLEFAETQKHNMKLAQVKAEAYKELHQELASIVRTGMNRAFDVAKQGFFDKMDEAFHAKTSVAGAFFASVIQGLIELGQKMIENLVATAIQSALTTSAVMGELAVINAAAAPTATLVSTATLGGAAAIGAGALQGALQTTRFLFSYSEGGDIPENGPGLIRGYGGPREDKMLILASPTEYILDAETTRNIGVQALDDLRAHKGKNLYNKFRKFKSGGSVGKQKQSEQVDPATAKRRAWITDLLTRSLNGERVQYYDPTTGALHVITPEEVENYRAELLSQYRFKPSVAPPPEVTARKDYNYTPVGNAIQDRRAWIAEQMALWGQGKRTSYTDLKTGEDHTITEAEMDAYMDEWWSYTDPKNVPAGYQYDNEVRNQDIAARASEAKQEGLRRGTERAVKKRQMEERERQSDPSDYKNWLRLGGRFAYGAVSAPVDLGMGLLSLPVDAVFHAGMGEKYQATKEHQKEMLGMGGPVFPISENVDLGTLAEIAGGFEGTAATNTLMGEKIHSLINFVGKRSHFHDIERSLATRELGYAIAGEKNPLWLNTAQKFMPALDKAIMGTSYVASNHTLRDATVGAISTNVNHFGEYGEMIEKGDIGGLLTTGLMSTAIGAGAGIAEGKLHHKVSPSSINRLEQAAVKVLKPVEHKVAHTLNEQLGVNLEHENPHEARPEDHLAAEEDSLRVPGPDLRSVSEGHKRPTRRAGVTGAEELPPQESSHEESHGEPSHGEPSHETPSHGGGSNGFSLSGLGATSLHSSLSPLLPGMMKDYAEQQVKTEKETSEKILEELEVRDTRTRALTRRQQSFELQRKVAHEQQLREATEEEMRKEQQTRQAQMKGLEKVLGAGFNKAFAAANQGLFEPMKNSLFNMNTVGGQILGGITDALIQMGEEFIAQQAITLASNLLFGTTTAATMTGIAAAAGPAATLTSIATLGGAAAVGSSGVLAALGLTKATTAAMTFAEGGVLLGPVFSPMLRGGAVAGEAGREIVLPLAKAPEMIAQTFQQLTGARGGSSPVYGGYSGGHDPALLQEMRTMSNRMREMMENPPVIVQPVATPKSLNQALNRAKKQGKRARIGASA